MAGALESEGSGYELSFATDQLVTTSESWAGTRCASGAGLACMLKRPEGQPTWQAVSLSMGSGQAPEHPQPDCQVLLKWAM